MTADTPRFGIPDALARCMSMPEQHKYPRTKLTLRRILAGSMATAATAGASLLAGSPARAAAKASPALITAPATAEVDGKLVAPFGRHLSFGSDPRPSRATCFHWNRLRLPDPDTVEWSRVRYTGFSFLAVEAVAGPSPVLKVSALAESGERIDHFEVRRTA
ncbi:hypothetical protein [Streptomyces sp. NPDC046332]|uniref:hypothetical protein n=1 Tax=Streptomyces sp. NPDC046332 TaxID=3155133 RepID=UPI0033D15EE8